jgi:hypothetical protein
MLKKSCNTFCTSLKFNRKYLPFFSVVNSEHPPCYHSTTEQYIFSCIKIQGIIKIVWYGYICFKQCTVTEFLVAEKSIMNIHKQLNSVTAVERSTVKNWPSWTADPKKGHAELSDAHHPGHPTTAFTEILLQSAEELIWNNRWIANIKITTELSISKATVKTLLIPWDIQKWVLVGLQEA